MKISLSQSSYSVRDAGEIAFGIMVLGIVLIPVAMGVGFVLSMILAVFWPKELFSSVISPICMLAAWLALMGLVIRRYQRIAASWSEPRRGKDVILLVEWISITTGLLLSYASNHQPSETLIIFRLFFAGLMLLLLLSHLVTYALLRYRPRTKEIIVWSALAISLFREMARHA